MSCAVNPRACIATRNAPKPSAGRGFVAWPRSDDRMQDCGPICRIAAAKRSYRSPASGETGVLPTNSMKAPSVAASFIWATVISMGAFIACVTTMRCTPCRRPSRSSISPSAAVEWPVASTRLCLAMSAMTSRDRGQQRPVARHADERAVLLRGADLVLGIEGREPDDAAPSSGHLRHVLDRRRVDSADRQVQIDAAEHLDARDERSGEIRVARRRFVMVLDDDRAHAAVARLSAPPGSRRASAGDRPGRRARECQSRLSAPLRRQAPGR